MEDRAREMLKPADDLPDLPMPKDFFKDQDGHTSPPLPQEKPSRNDLPFGSKLQIKEGAEAIPEVDGGRPVFSRVDEKGRLTDTHSYNKEQSGVNSSYNASSQPNNYKLSFEYH